MLRFIGKFLKWSFYTILLLIIYINGEKDKPGDGIPMVIGTIALAIIIRVIVSSPILLSLFLRGK